MEEGASVAQIRNVVSVTELAHPESCWVEARIVSEGAAPEIRDGLVMEHGGAVHPRSRQRAPAAVMPLHHLLYLRTVLRRGGHGDDVQAHWAATQELSLIHI